LCLFQSGVSIAGTPDLNADKLSGDWDGARTRMAERGIVWEIVYKGDALADVSGGLRRGAKYMDNLDVKVEADMEKLFAWPGTTLFLSLLSNHGGKLNSNNVGSFMGVDNIEVDVNTVKIYQAFWEGHAFEEKLSVLVGLYDLNSEFYANEASLEFLHPSFGIGAEIAQTGINGPSIFPTPSFGIRAKFQPIPTYYAQTTLLDGVPGDPDDPRGTHIQFNRGDGTLWVTEIAYQPSEAGQSVERIEPVRTGAPLPFKEIEEKTEAFGKYAIGYWRYSARFPDLIDTDTAGKPLARRSHGWYALGEHTVYQEPEDPSQQLGVFFRYGATNGDVDPIRHSASLGLRYTGLLPGRDEDVFGLASTWVRTSGKFREAQLAAGTRSEHSETVVEIFYYAQVKPWLAIQPDIQRILNPGFDPQVKNAWVLGARFIINF
jgi:porin